MADRGDTHYHVPNLNRWFLFSSAFFLLTMVWTVLDDASTEWKDVQREFRAIELEKAEAELQEMTADGLVARQQELQAVVDARTAALEAKADELAALETAVYETKQAHRNLEDVYKSDTANLKWDIYLYERAVADTGIAANAETRAKLERDEKANQELAGEVEKLAGERDAAKAALDQARSEIGEAEKDLAVATRELDRVQKKIESLDPSDLPTRLANELRDFPGLDFVGPNLKVQKYVLNGITFNLNFTKKDRIDMCTTCHMGMERPEFEDAAQPHRTHPRLDLFLSSKSPHPAKDIGCTVCHRGSGESLSFQHVDHRPDNDQEEHEWHEEYHWHKQHHWDYPMLRTQHTEAGCVQCHKSSMELIADDAPKVTEGYRLVERYGCYACHKIDWFPTKRRPGPSLVQMRGKLQPDFVESWIAHPRDFRPTTWMPQVFHLENYPADEVVVVSEYGQGEPILGKAWNDNAVAAITAFLYANHDAKQFPALPVQGDAERGREVMELVGCYACHNTAPHDGEQSVTNNLSEQAGRYNQHGPNLRGVATKVSPEWLFAWLKDPQAYWPETNMPNLRLTDRDAADVTAYIVEDPDGLFHDTPEGWAPSSNPLDRDVLAEQARWFFQKDGRHALQQKLETEWADTQTLAVAVGQAFVTNQGCYSCHEIRGMESMMPIGAELTSWASKTVDKLDFGMSYQFDPEQEKLQMPADVVAQARNQTETTLPWLDHHYHDGWLARKLAHPRSFDLAKVKNPKEKLRMPWFDFTDEQIDAIATFVLGLVEDDVPGAKMVPSPEKLAMDQGARMVRQKNCLACHVVDHGQVTFQGEDGHEHTVRGEILAFEGDLLPPRMESLEGLAAAKQKWEDWTEEELESVLVRLLDAQPGFGAQGESLEIPWDRLVSVTPANGGDFVRNATAYYLSGTYVANPDHDPSDEDSYPSDPWTWLVDDDGNPLVEDVDGVGRYYQETEYDKLRWTFAPPVLVNEGHKLQRDWFFAFLKDPFQLRQQIRVRMPSFHYEDGQAEAIADYFAGKARQDWYPRWARTMRLALGRDMKSGLANGSTENRWDLPADARAWPTTMLLTDGGNGLSLEAVAEGAGLNPSQVADIERGYAPEVAANFHKLFAFGQSQGFAMTGQLPIGYEQVLRSSPSHLAEHGDLIPVGERVAEKGVNCYQCHPQADGSFTQDPIAWAPPLQNVRARLREEWVREWLWNPPSTYVGTAMPANFATDMPAFQEQYPDSTNAQQIGAVMDWLYNMQGGAPAPRMAAADPGSLPSAQLAAILSGRGYDVVAPGEAAADTSDGGGATEPPPVDDSEEPTAEDTDDQAAATPPADTTPAPAAPVATGPGVVAGRVVFDGDPPAAKTLDIKAEQQAGCCTDGSTVDNTDRTLMIGAGNGIANVVVTIETDGKAAPNAEKTVLDQAKCRFEPHVSVLPAGSVVSYLNSDGIAHNIHTYSTKNPTMNQMVAAGASLDQTLAKDEQVKVTCDIHPWMVSWIYVTEATHHAVTGPDGSFSISGLQPGTYKVELWHESLGKAKGEVTVAADGTSAPLELKLGGGGGGRRRR